MAKVLEPILLRDFSKGRIVKSAVSPSLTPFNSLAQAINVDFGEIIGSGIVRKGKQTRSVITGNVVNGQAATNAVAGNEAAVFGANWQAQTFTVGVGQNSTLGAILKLYRIGTSSGMFNISLQATTAGKPNGTIIQGNSFDFDASMLTTSTAGLNYVFMFNPDTFLAFGSVYAVVLKYTVGDPTHTVEWMADNGNSLAGGQMETSTDSGSSWTIGSGAFYFIQQVLSTGYNFAPLGNYSFLINGLPKNVLAYRSGVTNAGTIYYYNVSLNDWAISSLTNLDPLAKIRFVVLNGSVFEANGIDAMHDSFDFGATWGTSNSLLTTTTTTTTVTASSVKATDAVNPFTVTFTTTFPHGLVSGEIVTIAGATPSAYNGVYGITVTSPTTFTYVFGGSATKTATGTITATQVVTIASVIPSLLWVLKNRMVASGWSAFPSRVYFSSIVDSTLGSGGIQASVLTSSGTTATFNTATPHGFVTGQTVRIRGVTSPAQFNGTYVITVISANAFTYTFAGASGASANGTIFASASFITWNTDPVNGDWIDINPDDGGIITAFQDVSSLLLVFKTNAMYRLNTINKTVDTENIFNVGAVAQEGVTKCLGLVYFYSGNGIYSTDGTFPQQISRIGVQDFVDAISSPANVFAGTDGFNVYFSIGPITLTFGNEDTRSYLNVVLKYSPRDQNWTVYTYNQHLGQYSQFGVVPSVTLIDTQYNGVLATVDSPIISDEGAAIPYDVETQELEITSRSNTKQISDMIVVYTKNGGEGSFLIKANDENFKPVLLTLNNRVNVGKDVNSTAEFFTFRWQGEVRGYRPILQGIHLPNVSDLGITK